jgi:hypothetical protein
VRREGASKAGAFRRRVTFSDPIGVQIGGDMEHTNAGITGVLQEAVSRAHIGALFKRAATAVDNDLFGFGRQLNDLAKLIYALGLGVRAGQKRVANVSTVVKRGETHVDDDRARVRTVG